MSLAETALRKIDEARSSKADWRPINRLPEPATPTPAQFPFDALGPILGLAGSQIRHDVQAPDALAAGSVLAAASLAAQCHADVILPHGQRAPLSLFVVSGAESGDRKTAVDQVALHPVEEARREQAREYLRAVVENEDDKDAPRPKARSLTIAKATTEGLQQMLKAQPSVGIFTGEGGELFGGHSLREERRSAGLAWLLKAWGGELLDAMTRGDGLSILLGRRVCMHVLVQPIVLRQLLTDPLAQGQGLLARCLIAQPSTLAGTRVYRECNPVQEPAVRAMHSRLTSLLHLPPPVRADGDGHELQPRPLPLAADARALWIEYYNEIERQQAHGGALEHARPFASKAAEQAARIAGVIEMVGNPQADAITDAAMDGGMRVAEFYLAEHVRLTGAAVADRHLSLLHTLVDWLRSRGRPVTHASVLQLAPRPVRALKAQGINELLAELAERHYIRRRGEVWEVNADA
jgi:putative DNA primase/helicase